MSNAQIGQTTVPYVTTSPSNKQHVGFAICRDATLFETGSSLSSVHAFDNGRAAGDPGRKKSALFSVFCATRELSFPPPVLATFLPTPASDVCIQDRACIVGIRITGFAVGGTSVGLVPRRMLSNTFYIHTQYLPLLQHYRMVPLVSVSACTGRTGDQYGRCRALDFPIMSLFRCTRRRDSYLENRHTAHA